MRGDYGDAKGETMRGNEATLRAGYEGALKEKVSCATWPASASFRAQCHGPDSFTNLEAWVCPPGVLNELFSLNGSLA